MQNTNLENTAKQAASAIQDAAGKSMDSADRVTTRVGERLESAASEMRDRLPDTGEVGQIADAMEDHVKQASTYLQDRGVSGIAEDVGILIREYPLQTLLLGVACGFLLSRFRTD